MNKKIGIILVNYKDYANRFLEACRDSIRKQTYLSDLIRVYIVDNQSSVESKNFIQTIYPEAKFLFREDGNFAAANNFGTRYAIDEGCEYIITANMDTVMDPDWLVELVWALDNNPEAGIAQSKVLLFSTVSSNQIRLINTLGNQLHFLGFGSTTHYQEEDRELLFYPLIKGYASGCSFIFSKEVFIKIGGWNESYYMYHDDVEFSFKARLAGYKIILAPKSIIFHKYEFSRSVRMLYYMERNRHLFMLHFYPLSWIILLFPAIIFMNLGLLIFASLKGWWQTWIKANIYIINPLAWLKIYRTRHEIKKFTKIPFKSFKDEISASLDFVEINNPLWQYFANPILAFYWYILKKVI